MRQEVYVVLEGQEEGPTIAGVASSPSAAVKVVEERLQERYEGTDEVPPTVTWEMLEPGWYPEGQNYSFWVEKQQVVD